MEWLIQGGTVVDGTGAEPFRADILVSNGKINRIGRILVPDGFPAERIIHADGNLITPGFIDIHRHGDLKALQRADDELLARQGITTVVNGNCGLSAAPEGAVHNKEIRRFLEPIIGILPEDLRIEDRLTVNTPDKDGHTENPRTTLTETMGSYMKALSETPREVNTGMLVGNGTLRACVNGYLPGKLSEDRLREVWRSLDEALSAGVLGVSLGLAYAPEFEYDKEGLIKALEPIRGRAVPLTVHIRNEGDGLLPALEEVIEAAKQLRVRLHVSHLKCIGKRNQGENGKRVLALFDKAEADGVRVDFDLYPYTVGSTQLLHLLPPSAQEGGAEMILRRLGNPSDRRRITEILRKPSGDFENIVELDGFDRIWVLNLRSEEFRDLEGKSLLEISDARGKDPYETLYDILAAEKLEAAMLDAVSDEENMLRFLKDRRANLISDAIYPAEGRYHPRVYGAFPEFLIRYVRDRKEFSIQEAVAKMTGKAAEVLGIDRGVLKEGAAADLNVWNIGALRAPADYRDPFRMCEGFRLVLCGGVPVVRNDRFNRTGSGCVIKRTWEHQQT